MITLNDQNRDRRRAAQRAALIATALLAGGCTPRSTAPSSSVRQSVYGPVTIVVAPALNYSGKAEFDPHAAADLMASELTTVEGVAVIPVARVVAALAAQGRTTIESPDHALSLAQQVGADAILVFSISEYEPYAPPIVGLTAQLYGVRPDLAASGLDPATGGDGAEQRPDAASSAVPFAQSQRVYDGSRDATVESVKRFARDRGHGAGPLGWKRVLASQQLYLRFCCHRAIEDLLTSAPRR
jgi:hypothetical protein